MASLVHTALRTFPAPAYLAMPGAGIDISSSSVKSVRFSSGGGIVRLESYQKMNLEKGVVFGGDIEDPAKLAEVLRTLRLRERIRFAHASLLEQKSYIYQTVVPREAKNLRAAAEFSLEGNVPIPPAEAVFDCEKVRVVEQGVVVAVTAYARRIVDSYCEAFNKSGITLLSLEVESQAAARALIGEEDSERTILLVDFGKDTTRIAVVDHGVASFSATVDVGGDTLTNAIMKNFNLPEEEAEKMKNQKGFLENEENKELYEALISTISVLRDELSKHISFWNSPDDHDVPRSVIQEVRIAGGNANIKGLAEFLSRSLDLPVTVGNPWVNAFALDEYIPNMPANESLQYASTIGLALRSHKRAW